MAEPSVARYTMAAVGGAFCTRPDRAIRRSRHAQYAECGQGRPLGWLLRRSSRCSALLISHSCLIAISRELFGWLPYSLLIEDGFPVTVRIGVGMPYGTSD